jgi:O-antigen ligase
VTGVQLQSASGPLVGRDPLRHRAQLLAVAPVASILAVAAGAAVAAQPKLVLGAAVAACVLVFAFRKPVANLAVLLFLTLVVPFQVLNRFGVGGANSAGLLLSDLFLLAGLAWAALTVPRLPLDRRNYFYALGLTAFLVFVALQFLHGVRSGNNLSETGQEARVLLSIGAFLIALPLVSHPASRRRLLGAVAVVALLLGAWGMLQWFGHLTFGAAGDVGVRSGVRLTSNGVGQLQGGEFGFPVAIVGSFTALAFGEIRSIFWRSLVAVALVLNVASCLVTFERSFWLATIVGVAYVVVFAPGRGRTKVLVVLLGSAVLALGALWALSPATFTTAQQRLNSISSYASDSSVRYRLVESQFVYDRIRAHPLDGSGFGASIFWGQPWAQVPPTTRHFSHDGYLWLAWKMGVPAAALLVVLLVGALFRRRRMDEETLPRVARRGAQGAIAGLLFATLAFPSFSQVSIVSTIGVLLAFAVSPAIGPSYRGARKPAKQGRLPPVQGLDGLKLAAVVVFLNEERFLPRLLESVARQVRQPDALLLVDDGSDDASPEIAAEFARVHSYATLVRRPRRGPVTDRLAAAAELQAFQSAVGGVDETYDVIAKLDGDLELTPPFFEVVMRAFAEDPGLGIAGSALRVPGEAGRIAPEPSAPWHIRGATKFYRRDCWRAISPLPEILGWDTIDEARAQLRGWRIANVALPGGEPLHLRVTGTYDGAIRGFRRRGTAAWAYGAHPLNVFASAAVRVRQPPLVVGSLAYLAGWTGAAIRGEPRAEPEVRRFVRHEQLRRLRGAVRGGGG